jgi:hypothetical protein
MLAGQVMQFIFWTGLASTSGAAMRVNKYAALS